MAQGIAFATLNTVRWTRFAWLRPIYFAPLPREALRCRGTPTFDQSPATHPPARLRWNIASSRFERRKTRRMLRCRRPSGDNRLGEQVWRHAGCISARRPSCSRKATFHSPNRSRSYRPSETTDGDRYFSPWLYRPVNTAPSLASYKGNGTEWPMTPTRWSGYWQALMDSLVASQLELASFPPKAYRLQCTSTASRYSVAVGNEVNVLQALLAGL
jgi:hypothetical protein